MNHSDLHKKTPTMISILLILSMVVSVFWAGSMPLMASTNSALSQGKITLQLSFPQDHSGLSENNAHNPEKCPASSDNATDHCTTCAFIFNMVGTTSPTLLPAYRAQRASYPWHSGRLQGLSKNVDLSPPKLG